MNTVVRFGGTYEEASSHSDKTMGLIETRLQSQPVSYLTAVAYVWVFLL